SQLAAVMLAVMWAYNGWEGVTPVAAEVRDPSRNIPKALLGGVAILIVVYVGANVAYHGVLSMSELKQAGMSTAPVMLQKQFSVFGSRAGEIAATAVSLVISLSAFGAINSNLMHSPRVAYAMGQDGVFIQTLGRVHANYRTPALAICTQATMASLMVIGFEFAQRNIERLMDINLFDLLTDYVIFSASVFQVLTVIGVMLLRRKHPEWERPYRVLGYPFTPLLFIGFYLWFLPTAYMQQSFSAHVALTLMALGLPAYFGYAAWRRTTGSAA
ncbi:MAG TPA: amino acid permease, partial [Planctomycetaceae bacterium]|nr:amino acid permease [Planctomycetaceae bacterium]